MPGGYDIVKVNKKRKIQTNDERKDKAFARACLKVGKEEVEKMLIEYKNINEMEQDGMIATLIAVGLSQIEIRSLLGVGGYRVSRLQKRSKMSEEEREILPQRPAPIHACSDEDRDAVRRSVKAFDTEPGYPCSHRETLEYFADPTIEWTTVYKSYVAECEKSHMRVLSFGRWRDYVRLFRPRLKLHRMNTDMCNRCYRIDIALKESSLPDERRAELLQEKEIHIQQAKDQRKAMNDAVEEYKSKFFPNENQIAPCVEDLENVKLEDTDDTNDGNKSYRVIVQCEDFGQSVPMPSYRAKRPNVNYFHSDLHLHMFNICNLITKQNSIFLYDERASGKGGNAVCSMRWIYHTRLIQQILNLGNIAPEMVIKVMDNCSGQNKSNITSMFDCLLSVLLYKRVANFYLLPGHSHMRADQVVGLCKKSLNKKDLFIPEQVASAMSEVNNMHAAVYKEDDFYQWEEFLRKYFTAMPQGFTLAYHFEFVEGCVHYKYLSSTQDEEGQTHILVQNVDATRKAILWELLNLPGDASITDIVKAKLQLPNSPTPQLAESKLKSVAEKLPYIPEEYRGYYPGFEAFMARHTAAGVDASAEFPQPEHRLKKKPGRPRGTVPKENGTPSILRFVTGRQNHKENLTDSPQTGPEQAPQNKPCSSHPATDNPLEGPSWSSSAETYQPIDPNGSSLPTVPAIQTENNVSSSPVDGFASKLDNFRAMMKSINPSGDN